MNLHRFHIVLSALLLFVSSRVLAQTSDVRGTVADSTTGERVPFASIVILGTQRGAATNLNGFFLITNVPPGTYAISAGAVGYTKVIRQIVVADGKPVSIDFRIAPEAVQMQEVVVRESAKRELKQVTTSVHLMDTRDLKLVPVTVQEDVFRSIQILPGIVSSSDVSSQFYVRGGASDQNLILLDGIRVYSPYHAFGIFSIFDSDIINATEVYTGAFPPGYGGRLSSVVNLATRDGRQSSAAIHTSLNFLSAKVQAEGPSSERTRWLINARKSLFSSSFKQFFHQDVPITFYDVFAKGTMEVEGTQTRFHVLTFQTGDRLPSATAIDPDYRWRNSIYGARATTLFGDRVYVNTLVSFSAAEAAREPKRGSPVSAASTSVKEFSLRGDATIYTNGGDLVFVGFDFSFPTLEYAYTNSTGLSRSTTANAPEIAGWGRYQGKIGPVQADAGIHLNAGSIGSGASAIDLFQPRVHVSLPTVADWRFKLSYGRHSQSVISLNNEDDLISLFEAWARVPGNLGAERADHYIASLQGNLIPQVGVEFQTYLKKYRSLVTYNRDKVDANDPDYVNGNGTASGVEAMVRYSDRPFDLYLAYTYGTVTITQGSTTYAPRYDRRHTVKSLAVYSPWTDVDLTLRWEFGTGFPYTPTAGFYDRLLLSTYIDHGYSGETGPGYIMLGEKNSARLPMYHRLDASLTYRFSLGHIDGALGAHLLNIYDRRNLFYFDRRTGQRIDMLPRYPTVTLQLGYQ